MSNHISLFGDEKGKRVINLGGTAPAISSGQIMDQVRNKRLERELARRRQENAVKIQAWWRGNRDICKARSQLGESFDRDPMSINALRYLALFPQDETRLHVWSTSVLKAGPGALFSHVQGPSRRSWLVNIRKTALYLLRSVARSPKSPHAVPNSEIAIHLCQSRHVIDGLVVGREIVDCLLKKDYHLLLASAILKIPPSDKNQPVLPRIITLVNVPFSTFTKDSDAFSHSLQRVIDTIIPIPLLPNRLPVTTLTVLSTHLPLLDLHLLRIDDPRLVNLPLLDKIHLLANFSLLMPPRYSKPSLIPSASLNTYLSLLNLILKDCPSNIFEAPRPPPSVQQPAAAHHSDESDDEPQSRILDRQIRSFDHLQLDKKTLSRLQSLASTGQLASLYRASTTHPATRPTMYQFLLNLYMMWPTKKSRILTDILASTGAGFIKELYRLYVRGNNIEKLEDIKHGRSDMWPPILLLTDIYTQALLTMDDDEFFSRGANRNPLTLDELTSFSRLLLHVAFPLYWCEDRQFLEDTNVPGLSINWLSVRGKVTKCLQAIHARDSRHPFMPKDHWLDSSQADMRSFAEAALLEDKGQDFELPTGRKSRFGSLITPRLNILNSIPFAIPFDVRVGIFRNFVNADLGENFGHGFNPYDRRERTQAVIRRTHVAEDGFNKLGSADLKRRVEITFIDQFGEEEAGIDGGGVFKEFFTSLSKEVFNMDRGLWLATKKNELYPNPHSYAKEAYNLQWYRFIGRILGKALYDGILIDVAFAGFFLAKWLGKQSFLDDLASLDPELYNGLLYLKRCNNPEELDLNFTIADNEFGVAKSIELIQDGSNTAVTNENRLMYIYLVCYYRLTKQIRQQSLAFFEGLSEIVNPKWLRMFNQQELQVMIGGVDSPIDLDDLRRNTNYGGLYDDNEITVRTFWKIVNEFTQEQRRALLRFVTSCSRPPLLGFGELLPKFAIRDAGNDQNRLPTASTCVNLLKLPRYTSERTMRNKLIQAINANAGFDLS